MLHEALLAAEILAARGFGLQVVNMPWLNRVDSDWLADLAANFSTMYVLEDHAPFGGLTASLMAAGNASGWLASTAVVQFAVSGWPACGTPPEALSFHGLDGASLADRILRHEDSAAR